MAFRPPDFEDLLARIARELGRAGLDFMLIGGQAVLLHGRPRVTEDIDLTLAAGPDELPRVLEACASLHLEPLPEDVESFVREAFVLPAREMGSSIRVDFIFSTTAYERQAIDRAVRVEVAGAQVPFATAEDLILHKLFAGRARDLEDVGVVVRRRNAELDWGYLEQWAESFSEVPGREDMPDRVRALRGRREG